MNRFVKPAVVLGLAGAMALGTMTASDARGRGWVAGAAGFAVGAAVGAAAANAAYGGYYSGCYGCYGGPAYYADPVYAAPAPVYSGDPAYAYTGDPSYNYGYAPYRRGYDTNYTGPMRARALEGHD